MSEPTFPAGWHADPHGRHELRYWDGCAWSDHVANAGQTSIDRSSPANTPVTVDDPTSGSSPRREAAVMMGCGGAVMVATALPWVTSHAGDLSALDVRSFGLFVAALGGVMALYGWSAWKSSRVRATGWAITATVTLALTTIIGAQLIELFGNVTLDLTGAQAGVGLHLTVLAWVVAIWPLVALGQHQHRSKAHRVQPAMNPVVAVA